MGDAGGGGWLGVAIVLGGGSGGGGSGTIDGYEVMMVVPGTSP